MPSIPSTISAFDLSCLVAEHVAGWTKHESNGKPTWTHPRHFGVYAVPPPFGNSVDHCLPLLENLEMSLTTTGAASKNTWAARIFNNGQETHHYHYSPRLPVAICFVLLKSRGFDVTP